MLEAYVRPLFQSFLVNPVARWLRNIPPNRITHFACITGILGAIAISCAWPKLAIILLLVSGFLDTLDGTVARLSSQITHTGAILDIVSDRLVELAIMFGLFAFDPVGRSLSTLLMLGSCYLCITVFLSIGIFTPHYTQKVFYHSPGLIERLEAFMFFILMIWLPDHFRLLSSLFSILVLVTSYVHFKRFIKMRQTTTSHAKRWTVSI